MAQSRLDLHEVLKSALGSDNVYFQPPANMQMAYPCIVYNRDDIRATYADNIKYKDKRRYQITVIDQKPDSQVLAAVESLPYCSYERFFTADNLNHDVFNLFF